MPLQLRVQVQESSANIADLVEGDPHVIFVHKAPAISYLPGAPSDFATLCSQFRSLRANRIGPIVAADGVAAQSSFTSSSFSLNPEPAFGVVMRGHSGWMASHSFFETRWENDE